MVEGLRTSKGRARVAAVAEAEVVECLPIGVDLSLRRRGLVADQGVEKGGETNGESIGIANDDEQLLCSSHGDVEPVKYNVRASSLSESSQERTSWAHG